LAQQLIRVRSLKSSVLIRYLTAFALALTATSGFAQRVQWGVKAGVPITDYFSALSVPFNPQGRQSYTSSTNRYTVGPTISVSLPFFSALSIEGDALYKRYHFRGTGFGIDTISQEKTTADSWEFPLMLKYTAKGPLVYPFVDVGVSFHRLTDVEQTLRNFIVPNPNPFTSSTDQPPQLDHRFNTGFVIGGGVDIHVLVLHLSPEIRYTRWGNQNFRSADGNLTSSQNQAEFLLGITF